MFNVKQEIFETLKKYIERKSQYKPKVMRAVVEETYPLVVFESNSNILESITQDRLRLNEVRNISFEISIFAINIGATSSQLICEELADLVCEVMNRHYLMQGGIDAKLININPSQATKYVLHFSYKWANK